MVFKDEKGNKYYTLNDKLYIDVLLLQITKHIGNLTQNISTGEINLIIHRNLEQKIRMPHGYMVQERPLEIIDFNRITLIECNKRIFEATGEAVKTHGIKFNPKSPMERQLIVPDFVWKDLGTVDIVSNQ